MYETANTNPTTREEASISRRPTAAPSRAQETRTRQNTRPVPKQMPKEHASPAPGSPAPGDIARLGDALPFVAHFGHDDLNDLFDHSQKSRGRNLKTTRQLSMCYNNFHSCISTGQFLREVLMVTPLQSRLRSNLLLPTSPRWARRPLQPRPRPRGEKPQDNSATVECYSNIHFCISTGHFLREVLMVTPLQSRLRSNLLLPTSPRWARRPLRPRPRPRGRNLKTTRQLSMCYNNFHFCISTGQFLRKVLMVTPLQS